MEQASLSPDLSADAAPPTERLTLDGALALGARLVQEGRLDEADSLLTTILDKIPGQPDALHFQGILRHVQGDSEAGVALIRRAIEAMPEQPGPWNNLGNVLLESQRIDEAARAYERAVTLAGEAPSAAEPYNNLGTIYRKCLNWAQAERACRDAIALRPDFGDAWYNLSLALMGQDRVAEGLIANSKAIALWPRHLLGREQVIRALTLLDRRDEAAKLYREWLAEDPDNPVAQHQLAACLGDRALARASDAYVEQVFDSFANSFDAKLEKLGYQTPERLAQALQEALGPPRANLDIVDAGCGTGLCGPLLAPYKRSLVGVDLSVGMLRKAKQRQVYDSLYKIELVAYLADNPESSDLIVSADTLVYFGPLEQVATVAYRALRVGGTCAFSVEEAAGEVGVEYQLTPTGRYTHTASYIEGCMHRAGFSPVCVRRATLRMERGEPVAGLIVTARKT